MRVTEKYIFFWGSIYSQWAMYPIKINERLYNCNEQYMMHRKALLFEDFDSAKLIMEAKHPSDQKGYGRTVKNFKKDEWETIAREVVYQANLAKFTQNLDLQDQLLATGDKI